jgi:thymidylate synthase ThyX
MAYDAKIVLDSLGPNGSRLTTFELSYPRFVHAETMTHRMFSRNAASSRAIPTDKLIARIMEDPAMPVWWGKNQSGMQAREELSDEREEEFGNVLSPREQAKRQWLLMRDTAVEGVRALERIRQQPDGSWIGLHKQVSNRPLEAWMFITVIVTATEFSNFFALRDHADAQPELAACASKAHALYKTSIPQQLHPGMWHLPYVTHNDELQLRADGYDSEKCCLISTGRCARVSYLTHDGVRDPNADVALAMDRIRPSGHMSPFEHVAQALTWSEWEEYAQWMANEWIRNRVPFGNLWGWMQLRKTIENEHDFGLIAKGR